MRHVLIHEDVRLMHNAARPMMWITGRAACFLGEYFFEDSMPVYSAVLPGSTLMTGRLSAEPT